MYKGNEESLNMIMGDADYDDFGNATCCYICKENTSLTLLR